MPSTRNQKAREKRSGQSDVISDLEYFDITLRNFSKESYYFEPEGAKAETDSTSVGLHENTVVQGKVSVSLSSQILAVINTKITEQVIPDLHWNIGALGSRIFDKLHHRSSGLQKNTGANTTRKAK